MDTPKPVTSAESARAFDDRDLRQPPSCHVPMPAPQEVHRPPARQTETSVRRDPGEQAHPGQPMWSDIVQLRVEGGLGVAADTS